MASILKHLRSSTADKRPTASGLADGQIALNTASGTPAMFFKDSAGNIVKVGPAHIGATAPNVSPAGSAGNSDGEFWVDESLTTRGLKYYDGATFINLTPSGTTSTVGLVELATDAETQTGTDNVRAVTPSGLQSKISDSTSTTSSTTIASSTAVKSAFDLANAALPKTGGTLTGELLISPSGSLVFEGSSDDSFETTIAVTNPTADRTITFPNVTGNVVTTGDSGTVTSTMILDDTIVNADINSAAAIAHSKLANITAGSVLLGNASNVPTATALSGDVTINSSGVTAISAGVIVNADINASAAIVDTKLDTIATADKVSLSALNIDGATDIGGALENGDLFVVDDGAGGTNRKAQAFRMAQLTYSGVTGDITVASGGTAAISAGVIVNADVNASAAIAGTKISPDFGSQTITTSGVVSAALGAAATPSLTFTGDLNTGIYSPGADQVAISTNGTGRLFINSSGQVGVGTSSQSDSQSFGNAFEIRGTDGAAVYSATSDNATRAYFATYTGGGYLGTETSHPFIFRTNNTERLRITSAGLVGVGTSSPGYALDVLAGSGGSVSARLRGNNGANNNTQLRFYGSNAAADQWAIGGSIATNDTGRDFHIYDLIAGQNRFAINSSGFVGIGTSSPSAKLVVDGGTSGDQLRLGTDPHYYKIGRNSTSGPLEFYGTQSGVTGYVFGGVDGTRLTIDSSGRVGIGTTSPTAQLTSTSTVQITGFANPSGGAGLELGYDGTNSIVQSFNRGTSAFRDLQLSGNTIQMSIAGGEAARVDSSRRLLVGTSSVSHTTTVVVQGNTSGSTEAGYLSLRRGETATSITTGEALGVIDFRDSDGNRYAEIYAQADAAAGSNDYPGRLVFSTTADGASSPTERMRISQNGKTQMFANANDNVLVMRSAEGAGTATYIFAGARSATGIGDGTVVFGVFTNGNAVNTNNSYGALSDIKLKENIVDANSQWSDIKALQVRKYNFKEETGQQTHTQIGLVAQEVELVSPGLVTESPDRDAEGNDLGTVTKSVNYSVLYMKAVKALQEAMERIETLEAKVAALEAN